MFRQGDCLQGILAAPKGVHFAESRVARQHQLPADSMIRGVSPEKAREISLRPQRPLGDSQVQRGVNTLAGIDRIIAAVE